MHRIDGRGNAGNRFTSGNPATGQEATTVTAEWLNDVQENIAQAVEAAGESLRKGDGGQLARAMTLAAGRSIETMAQLRAAPPGGKVQLKGHGTPLDGGGGTFFWDASATVPDDGGTVIEPDGHSGSGRWRRDVAGTIYDVRWFGAVGDGGSDDTAALQRAINAMPEGAVLSLPVGTYCHHDLSVSRQLRLEGTGAGGTRLRYMGQGSGITRHPAPTNGIGNGLDATDIDFQLATPWADATLITIMGGNSFCRFTQCRFGGDGARTAVLTLGPTAALFQPKDVVKGERSGATATVFAVEDGGLRVIEDGTKFARGETITTGRAGARAAITAIRRPGASVGVRFVGSTGSGDGKVTRPSVYGLFDQCEFIDLKIGVKQQYAGYKKFNESMFVDCSFQFVDYAIFDGAQSSGIKLIGGGIEIWRRTGIYSDGDHFKIYGTRFERGGVPTEATYAPSFGPADVNPARDAITLPAHAFRDGDEVVLESPRDTGDRNKVLWPAGIVPGEIYYIVNAAPGAVQLAAFPDGPPLALRTPGESGPYYLRKLSNIPWQFGYNSDLMGAVIPHTAIGGGPERHRYDGRRTAHYGLRSVILDSQTVAISNLTEVPRRTDVVPRTLRSLPGQAQDMLQYRDSGATLKGGLSKGFVPFHGQAAQSASGHVTIDADTACYHVLTTSAAITRLTIAGGHANQELILRIAYGGAHGVDFSGSGIRLAAGSLAATAAAGRSDILRLIKDGSSGEWFELSRSLNLE